MLGDTVNNSEAVWLNDMRDEGNAVTLDTLRGHVWVGDIIFTRCPGPCRKMSREMNELSEALSARSNARLVSLTTDPTYDTPAVFRDYIQQLKLNARPDRWHP